jgi:hypothetical protein
VSGAAFGVGVWRTGGGEWKGARRGLKVASRGTEGRLGRGPPGGGSCGSPLGFGDRRVPDASVVRPRGHFGPFSDASADFVFWFWRQKAT